MAATKQVFSGTDSTFFSALKKALEGTGFFDSVTLSSETVTATKNGADLLEVKSGSVTCKNSSGVQMFKSELNNQMDLGYRSITTVSGAVMLIMTQGGNPSDLIRVYVDQTMADGVIFGTHTDNSGVVSFVTACPESNASDSGYGLNAPLSTAYSNASLYKMTSQMPDGGIAVARHCYGIRFSPSMHTVSTSAAGVTPRSITINDTPYVTDGTVCMMDV